AGRRCAAVFHRIAVNVDAGLGRGSRELCECRARDIGQFGLGSRNDALVVPFPGPVICRFIQVSAVLSRARVKRTRWHTLQYSFFDLDYDAALARLRGELG